MLTNEEAKSYLAELDLDYLADAMCSSNYPLPRWSRTDVMRCLQHYKNFLWLQKIHPDLPLVPTKEMDECWHNHILYTKRYTEDCQQIFGRYLHHHPAIPGKDDATLTAHYLRTKELYLHEFKIPMQTLAKGTIDLSPAAP